jgi:hypothetical protein
MLNGAFRWVIWFVINAGDSMSFRMGSLPMIDSCECGGKLEYKKTISHFNVAAQATGSEYFVLMKK